jgi:hypothetical protein
LPCSLRIEEGYLAAQDCSKKLLPNASKHSMADEVEEIGTDETRESLKEKKGCNKKHPQG